MENELRENREELVKQLKEEREKLENELKESREENKELQNKIDLLEQKVENLSGNPVKFTEKAPVYLEREGDVEVAKFEGYDELDIKKSFRDFCEYCKENVKSEFGYYVLEPLWHCDDWIPTMHKSYTVYAEKVENGVILNPMLCEGLTMYSDVLGNGNYYGDAEVTLSSIRLLIFIVPFTEKHPYNMTLRFGDNNNSNTYFKKYINIYSGTDCIATCYYDTSAYVSQIWWGKYFDNYFKEAK